MMEDSVMSRVQSTSAAKSNYQPALETDDMKNQTLLKRLSLLVAMCFASVLALCACKNTGEHPKSEHPQQQHPGTNAPPHNP
jgi:hypothetical protein